MTPEISIIIVNYNSGDLLLGCLRSIRSNLSVPYEVIVVDNASTDGSLTLCEEFRTSAQFAFYDMGSNAGFAKANNFGAAHANGKILHFLNPDTEIPEDMDDDYRAALSAPDALYINPLENMDGSIENDMMPVPNISNLILHDLRCSKAKHWYRGASVIISAENFRKIGGWCEEYFLYSEDLEFFYQADSQGLPIKELPAVIFHLGGGCSSASLTDLEREIQVQRSTRLFFRRHFPHGYFISNLYLLLHILTKNPARAGLYIKAWYLSGPGKD